MNKKSLGISVLFFLLLMVLFRLYRAFIGADIAVLGPAGGMDLHSYWDPAHAILRGIDPYPAVIAGVWNTVKLGIPDPAATSPELLNFPASAPLALVLLSPLAILKWTQAKIIWSMLNILVASIIPFVLFSTFKLSFSRWAQFFLALLFVAMTGPAITIQLGNLGLVCILFCLLAVWLAPRNWLVAGILLGIGISKLTLTGPLLIFFFIFGYWRVALIAIFMQILGLAGLSLVVATPPLTLLTEYVQIALPHYRQIGELNAQSRIFQAKLPDLIGSAIAFVGWLVTIIGIAIWWIKARNKKPLPVNAQTTKELELFVLLSLAALPFVYHRLYDSIPVFFLAPLAIVNLEAKSRKSGVWLLVIACFLTIGNFLYPRFLISNLPASFTNILPFIDTGICILAWAASLCFLFTPVSKPQSAFLPENVRSSDGLT